MPFQISEFNEGVKGQVARIVIVRTNNLVPKKEEGIAKELLDYLKITKDVEIIVKDQNDRLIIIASKNDNLLTINNRDLFVRILGNDLRRGPHRTKVVTDFEGSRRGGEQERESEEASLRDFIYKCSNIQINVDLPTRPSRKCRPLSCFSLTNHKEKIGGKIAIIGTGICAQGVLQGIYQEIVQKNLKKKELRKLEIHLFEAFNEAFTGFPYSQNTANLEHCLNAKPEIMGVWNNQDKGDFYAWLEVNKIAIIENIKKEYQSKVSEQLFEDVIAKINNFQQGQYYPPRVVYGWYLQDRSLEMIGDLMAMGVGVVVNTNAKIDRYEKTHKGYKIRWQRNSFNCDWLVVAAGNVVNTQKAVEQYHQEGQRDVIFIFNGQSTKEDLIKKISHVIESGVKEFNIKILGGKLSSVDCARSVNEVARFMKERNMLPDDFKIKCYFFDNSVKARVESRDVGDIARLNKIVETVPKNFRGDKDDYDKSSLKKFKRAVVNIILNKEFTYCSLPVPKNDGYILGYQNQFLTTQKIDKLVEKGHRPLDAYWKLFEQDFNKAAEQFGLKEKFFKQDFFRKVVKDSALDKLWSDLKLIEQDDPYYKIVNGIFFNSMQVVNEMQEKYRHDQSIIDSKIFFNSHLSASPYSIISDLSIDKKSQYVDFIAIAKGSRDFVEPEFNCQLMAWTRNNDQKYNDQLHISHSSRYLGEKNEYYHRLPIEIVNNAPIARYKGFETGVEVTAKMLRQAAVEIEALNLGHGII